ncbi:ABC transporter permease [Phytoactinopolyspora limicola]|uniref:ABC transporter permease n=1 Tax=Phytoactinopolyspora limicola TaxID=2715536 RepID=UPI001409AA08|nr:ABC transporter permease [Phytoactinopolyspora limicola]
MSLSRYAGRRLLLLVPVLLTISLVTFFLSRVLPGDPARLIAGVNASDEQVARLRAEFGLDRPLFEQYVEYLSRVVRGDLGTSIVSRRSVSADLADFFPATLELAIAAMVLTAVVGIPLGVAAALRRGGIADNISGVVSLAGVALPVFWVATVGLLIFYYKLGWLPGSGRLDRAMLMSNAVPSRTGLLVFDSLLAGNLRVFGNALWHLVLPASCLSLVTLPRVVRITRSSMREVLEQPYVAAARAKGLPERRVIGLHALKNALIPVLSIGGLSFGFLLGGSVLVEQVFGWPGIGKYAFDSINYLDYNAVLGVTLLATVVFITVNLLVDVVYARLDPRIRLR